MGRKTWEAKNSKKKRSSYKNGLGKKWEANRCQKRNRHLEGDGKNGKQIEKKKRRHLKWDGKTGKERTRSKKTVILQTWPGKKKWEAHRSKKKRWRLESDGKNGKQRTPRNNGHLTQRDGEKKWEANRSTKKLAS